ncbi:MAG: cell division protein FtsZ [Candidatus Kapaibacteriales bacterium]
MELERQDDLITRIAVVGVGGAGCNCVEEMVKYQLNHVELIAINTDLKQLRKNSAPIKLQIGVETTGGRGAGSKPEIGEQAAKEDYQKFLNLFQNKNMVIIVTGMGGGTGTGASPIVAKAAHESGCLTLSVVVTPLDVEGPIRLENAKKGIANLRRNVDAMIVVSNQRLTELSRQGNLSVLDAFSLVNRYVYEIVFSISYVIHSEGIKNIDYHDIRTLLLSAGDTLIGTASANNQDNINEIIEKIINVPLLEGIDLRNGKSALIYFTTGRMFPLSKANETISKLREVTNDSLNVNWGFRIDEELEDTEANIIVMVTGFKNTYVQKALEDIGNVNLPTESELEEELSNEVLTPDFNGIPSVVLSGFDSEDENLPAYFRKNKVIFNSKNVESFAGPYVQKLNSANFVKENQMKFESTPPKLTKLMD